MKQTTNEEEQACTCTCNEQELKKLLIKHHPDTGDGNLEEFQKIKEALDRREQ